MLRRQQGCGRNSNLSVCMQVARNQFIAKNMTRVTAEQGVTRMPQSSGGWVCEVRLDIVEKQEKQWFGRVG